MHWLIWWRGGCGGGGNKGRKLGWTQGCPPPIITHQPRPIFRLLHALRTWVRSMTILVIYCKPLMFVDMMPTQYLKSNFKELRSANWKWQDTVTLALEANFRRNRVRRMKWWNGYTMYSLRLTLYLNQCNLKRSLFARSLEKGQMVHLAKSFIHLTTYVDKFWYKPIWLLSSSTRNASTFWTGCRLQHLQARRGW